MGTIVRTFVLCYAEPPDLDHAQGSGEPCISRVAFLLPATEPSPSIIYCRCPIRRASCGLRITSAVIDFDVASLSLRGTCWSLSRGQATRTGVMTLEDSPSTEFGTDPHNSLRVMVPSSTRSRANHVGILNPSPGCAIDSGIGTQVQG
jgi:hypothetical protein